MHIRRRGMHLATTQTRSNRRGSAFITTSTRPRVRNSHAAGESPGWDPRDGIRDLPSKSFSSKRQGFASSLHIYLSRQNRSNMMNRQAHERRALVGFKAGNVDSASKQMVPVSEQRAMLNS
eukprot:GHVU01213511.1.p1 GENE.GHVU01213511.1~~GHVU01213511.1.p1  ORF type:complete len:121 (-),score=5.99 GHVU01213511.1:628-990(-)